MKFLTIFVASVSLFCSTLAQDYCRAGICDAGVTHIDCNNSGAFAISCPGNARLVAINPEGKPLLLQMVNVRRNIVAGGNLIGFPAATRMPTVVWSNDLQRLAQLSVKRCSSIVDNCRNTATFTKVGQLIFYQTVTGGNINYRDHLIQAVQTWYGKYQYANAAKIASYQKTDPNYGAFATLVNQRVTHMGCGSATYKKTPNSVDVVTICNFASRNTEGAIVYEGGTKASGCTTGTNPNYTNLCSPSEVVDPNAA